MWDFWDGWHAREGQKERGGVVQRCGTWHTRYGETQSGSTIGGMRERHGQRCGWRDRRQVGKRH